MTGGTHQRKAFLTSAGQINSFDRRKVSAMCGKLGAFINQVQAQSGKTLIQVDADGLIRQASDARAAIGCK